MLLKENKTIDFMVVDSFLLTACPCPEYPSLRFRQNITRLTVRDALELGLRKNVTLRFLGFQFEAFSAPERACTLFQEVHHVAALSVWSELCCYFEGRKTEMKVPGTEPRDTLKCYPNSDAHAQ